MKTDKMLPYTEIDEDLLPPRDPVVGYVKVGSRESSVRYSRAGKPWVAPTRLLDPARFEVVTREKRTEQVKGKGGTTLAGETFSVDFGYVRNAEFHALEEVGEQPSSLRVRLLYPRWNQNLIAFMGAYGGGEWVCRGNGVEAIDVGRGPCICPCPRLKQFDGVYAGDHPDDGTKLYQCKPHAQLNVILEDARVFGGFWPFKTTSYETIANLTKSLRIFEEMFGRVDGLPLELRVMAVSKQLSGGGRTTQPIVTLVLPASMSTARQVAKDAAAESRKFLPAGRPIEEEVYREAVVSEMTQEAASYAGEFMPAEGVEEMKPAPIKCYTCGAGGVELVSVALHQEGPRRAFVCKDCEGKIERGEIKRDDDGQGPKEPTQPLHRCGACEGVLDSAGVCQWCKAGRKPPKYDEERRPPAEEAKDPNQEGKDGIEDDSDGGSGGDNDGEKREGDHCVERGSIGGGGDSVSTTRVEPGADGRQGDAPAGGPGGSEAPEAVEPDDSDRDKQERIARKVLYLIGWEQSSIDKRIAYQVVQGRLDVLLEHLARVEPEALAKATQSEGSGRDEPEDDLPF